jgi:hypothetical protein
VICLALIVIFQHAGKCQNEAVVAVPMDLNDNVADDSLSLQTIRNVTINGYKRTKSYIVERELAVHTGDRFTKAKLRKSLRQTREQLMNTALFVDVIVTPYEVGYGLVDVVVEVKERWYIFPVPYFKVVDRNWNVWIKEHDASLDRVNIGMKVTHTNVTGINDKLNLWVIGGYTQQLQFNYFRPYFDRKLRFGYGFGLVYARNREVNYASEYNKLMTLDTSFFNRKVMHGDVALSYRRGSRLRMQFRLGFTQENFDSSIAKLNPNFLGAGKTKATYFDITYAAQYYKVDYIPYPLRGWYVEGSVTDRISKGGNVDMLQFNGKALSSWRLMHNTWFALQGSAVIRFPASQPYYNSKLLGFGDVTMQGMEYYVVDGTIGGVLRGTLRRQVFKFTIKNLIKSKSHNEIPFTFFLKAYGNLGYVYAKNPGTSYMNNKLLRTGGFGLDILTIYDWAIKLDFSFNQFDSGGKLYLHTQSDF